MHIPATTGRSDVRTKYVIPKKLAYEQLEEYNLLAGQTCFVPVDSKDINDFSLFKMASSNSPLSDESGLIAIEPRGSLNFIKLDGLKPGNYKLYLK